MGTRISDWDGDQEEGAGGGISVFQIFVDLFVLGDRLVPLSFSTLAPRGLQVRLARAFRVDREHRKELFQVTATAVWAYRLAGTANKRFETTSAIQAFEIIQRHGAPCGDYSRNPKANRA